MYGILTHIYHILPLKTTIHVGKYTSAMDGMGYIYQDVFFPIQSRCLFSKQKTSGSFEAHAWRHGGMGDLAEKGPWQITQALHVVDIPTPEN